MDSFFVGYTLKLGKRKRQSAKCKMDCEMLKGFRSLRTAFSVTFHSRKVTQSDHSKGEMARFGEAFLQIVKFWLAELHQTTPTLLSKFAYTILTNYLPPNLRWLLSFAVVAYHSHLAFARNSALISLATPSACLLQNLPAIPPERRVCFEWLVSKKQDFSLYSVEGQVILSACRKPTKWQNACRGSRPPRLVSESKKFRHMSGRFGLLFASEK